jgi:hypothetical protein
MSRFLWQVIAATAMIGWCGLPLAAAGADGFPPDLRSLRGFQIGTTCNANANLDAVDLRPRCTKVADFHAEFLEVHELGRHETIILQFTPDDRLWSVTSQVKWESDAPLADEAIASMVKRFGHPIVYEDFRSDPIFVQRQRRHASVSTSYSAAWASGGAPWKGSLNTHIAFHSCNTSGGSAADCALSEVRAGMTAWSSRLAMLKGIVTVAEFQFENGRIARLNTVMQDPSYVALEKQARERGAQELGRVLERSRSRSMPEF